MTSTEKTVVVIDKTEGDADKMTSSTNLMRKRSGGSYKRKSSSRSRIRRSITSGYTSVVSSMHSGRSSILGLEPGTKRPPRKYLNTYQLNPTKPFNRAKVTAIIENTLQEFFLAHVYHSQQSPALALIIAGELRYRVRYQRYDRYRIIIIVTIGQRKFQSYNNAVAFLWDYSRDAYVNCTMQVPTAFIQVTLFAVYLD